MKIVRRRRARPSLSLPILAPARWILRLSEKLGIAAELKSKIRLVSGAGASNASQGRAGFFPSRVLYPPHSRHKVRAQ
jgi:hypothetical protein